MTCKKGRACKGVAMSASTESNVDYRLLSRLSSLVLCSACFRHGKVTPVPQLLEAHRRPKNLCPACRSEAIRDGKLDRVVKRRRPATVIPLNG